MKRPTSSSGFWVADRPIRWTSRPAALARAARASAPGARRAWSRRPRGSRRRCTSASPSNSSCARPVSIRYSDSGVVIRMSGGWRSIAWRSRCGVSPVRTATRQLGADPAQRRAQVALDVVGERLQRRDVDEPRSAVARSAARRASRSIAHRNAASVLPEPVGAEISTCSPEAIAGHACAWAAVGARERAREPLARAWS